MSDPSRDGDRPEEPSTGGPRSAEDLERAAEAWAGRVAGWLVRTSVRAKEEAEDIWAEAQELRRRP